MNYTQKIVGAAVLASCIATVGHAQEGPLPLAPIPPSGGIVAPYFDGYYTNPDGTYTFSFGYMNR
ncbi:MAG: hypothetical protein LBG44_01265, partial [Gemmatimonadota bacterium]|nr:hypothetical protein [Gemmatimonadota bacterium]